MTRIFRILIPVADIERAVLFYSTVLAHEGQRVSSGRHYFNCGGITLACFDPIADGDEYEAKPNPEPMYLAVPDLQATFAACAKAGATFLEESPPGVGPLGEIAKRPWGEESFYIHDPFGNPLCFVSEDTVFTGGPNA